LIGVFSRVSRGHNVQSRTFGLVLPFATAARVEAQAERKARERIGSIAHTMALEAQRAGSAFEQRQIDAMKSELLRGRRSRLWD